MPERHDVLSWLHIGDLRITREIEENFLDLKRIAVRAHDAKGHLDEDRIEPAANGWMPPRRQADGSDADRACRWRRSGAHWSQ